MLVDTYIDIIAESALPDGGRYIHLLENGEAIALFKRNGRIYALGNRCVHRGGSIGDGEVTDSLVTCPMHEWVFRLDDGACIDNPDMRLQTYTVEVADQQIRVRIEND